MISIVVCYATNSDSFRNLQQQLQQIKNSVENIELLYIQNDSFANRRLGFQIAKNDSILFLDSDVSLVNNFNLCSLLELARIGERESRIFTGCYLNPSPADSQLRAYNWICNRWLGLNKFDQPQKVEKILGGCFLLNRKSFENDLNPFENIWGGEENFLLKVANKLKIKIIFDPKLSVFHHNRISFWSFVRRAWIHGSAKSKFEIVTSSNFKINQFKISKASFWIVLHYSVVLASKFITDLASVLFWKSKNPEKSFVTYNTPKATVP